VALPGRESARQSVHADFVDKFAECHADIVTWGKKKRQEGFWGLTWAIRRVTNWAWKDAKGTESGMTDTEQLIELTKRWNTFEDIPRSQQIECAEIGKRLNAQGGMQAMQKAYYAAKFHNKAASTIQAYWHGIGDWQW
jgi:hypothetical protein